MESLILKGLTYKSFSGNKNANLQDIIVRENSETNKEYEIRKRLSFAIYRKYEINPMACVVLSSMILKKIRYGLFYEPELETLISEILKKE